MTARQGAGPDYVGFFLPLGVMMLFIWWVAS